MESKFKLCVKVLHLPMVGDWILSRLANHPTLQCFLADRAIKLTNEGFEALSSPSAATRCSRNAMSDRCCFSTLSSFAARPNFFLRFLVLESPDASSSRGAACAL